MTRFLKKDMLSVFFIFLLLFSIIQSTMATFQSNTTILSSGAISYSSLSPTLNGVNASPWGIIGDDYLLSFSRNNPSPSIQWTSDKLAVFAQYNCGAARLGMIFSDCGGYLGSHSNYDKTRMSQVLDLLSSVGVKGVLDLHNTQECHGYFGSQAMVNQWVQVATDFKGDTRIASFNVFNEPNSGTWATSGPGYSGAMNSGAKAQQFLAYLIDAIRAVDPTRTIMYPCFSWMDFPTYNGLTQASERTAFMNDITNAGILNKGNIVYDVAHPYLWESYPGQDVSTNPVVCADFWMTDLISPMASLLGGSQYVWVGETYPWSSEEKCPFTGNHYTDSKQIAYITEFINQCVSHQVGFQLWCYWSRQADYNYNSYNVALQASIY